MNNTSVMELAKSAVVLNINDMRNYAINKMAKAQGRSGQKEHATWADFIECLQEVAKATADIDIPDLTQEEVERRK